MKMGVIDIAYSV